MSALVLLEHGVRWKDRSWGVIFVHFFILADVNEIYFFIFFLFVNTLLALHNSPKFKHICVCY